MASASTSKHSRCYETAIVFGIYKPHGYGDCLQYHRIYTFSNTTTDLRLDMSLPVFLFFLPLFALASPSGHVRRQSDTSVHCGTWDSVTTGPYSINLDQWGATGATSGESCARWISLSGTTAAWVNNWTWTGGTGVKSYTDLQLNEGINQQLSAISSMPVRLPSLLSSYRFIDVFNGVYSRNGLGARPRVDRLWPTSRTISSRPPLLVARPRMRS